VPTPPTHCTHSKIDCATPPFPRRAHIPSSVPRRLAGDDQGVTTPRVSCLNKVLISVARIQKRQALRVCSESEDGSQGASIFDMGLSLTRMTNMIWRTLHHRGLRKPLRQWPQCLVVHCPRLNRNLSPLPRPLKTSPRVRRTVSLSVVGDLKFVLTISGGPKHLTFLRAITR
jgi:hypothetical protein